METNDIITLNDNRKYVVISKAMLNNHEYIFIIEKNNVNNYKILKVNNNELIVEKDQKILAKLCSKFLKLMNEKMNQY